MTDRMNFEAKAINCGATILEATDTMLKVLATNGIMITTYHFDDNGKFVRISH